MLISEEIILLGDGGEGKFLITLEIIKLHLKVGILVVVTTSVVRILDGVALGEGIQDLVVDNFIVVVIGNLDSHRCHNTVATAGLSRGRLQG